jgi:hypothetical protein
MLTHRNNNPCQGLGGCESVRLNFNQLLLGCKNIANKGFYQILSTNNIALTTVNKTIIKKSVLSHQKWDFFCNFALVLPVSLTVDKLDIYNFKPNRLWTIFYSTTAAWNISS